MSEVMRIAEAPAFLALKESPASGGNVPSSRQPPVLKGTASSNVAIEIVSDLQSVAVVWKVFEKLADCTPFQTFGWLVQWQAHIGEAKGTVPVVVFGRYDDGDILFILPLAIERRGGLRRLTWLGMELGDYNGPLLADRFSRHPAASDFAAIWGSILALLRSNPQMHFDLADLPKMPEMIGEQKNPFLQLQVFPNRSGAYITTLGANWDEFYAAKRSASSRKTMRKKQRHLEAQGKISFVEVVDFDASVQTLETLIEQKSGAFARMGVENIFMRRGYPEFYRAMVTDPESRDIIHMSRLEVGSMTAATNVALQFRERYYLILSSYHGGELARLGPGRFHLHELLRYTIERGFRYFDFTIGDEPYKLDWSDTKLVLYDHLTAYTLRGWLAVSAANLQRRAIRFIKQTPVLWHLAVRVRAFIGRRKWKSENATDESE